MSTGVSGVTRVIVVGAGGRLGSRVCALAHADGAFELSGAVVRPGSAYVGRAAAAEHAGRTSVKTADSAGVFGVGSADVVIDAATAAGTMSALEVARRVGCALLVCSTGLGDKTVQALRAESASRAVLLAPNTSLGVTALADLARRAAVMLSGYDCSIVEAHHHQKKDAPSGTALRLADAARAGGAGLSREQIVSVRGGDVVGEHTVRFAGPGEYVELTHRATSRDLFARGALTAAAWLGARSAGWWRMEDVLALPAR